MTVTPLHTFTIGGSDAAAAAGIDPHKSRMKLWLEKRGVIPVEETEAMHFGKLLEPVIFAELEARGVVCGTVDPDDYRDHVRPWLTGRPDGIAYPDDGAGESHLLEVKTVGQWAKREWSGEPPLAYVAQIQHYLHLTGLDRALLAVLVGGQKLELTELERNQRAIDRLLELEEEFYGYLVDGVRPEVRHDDAAAIAAEFGHSTPLTIRLDKEGMRTLRELRAKREQEATVKRQREELENRLKVQMGEAEMAISPHDEVVIRWKSYEQHRFDTARYREEHPRIAATYSKTTSVRRFEVL